MRDNSDIKGQILTIQDVAEALMVSVKTVTRMLQDGAIPGFKVSNQWRFHRDDLNSWLKQKRRGTEGHSTGFLHGEVHETPLSRLVNEQLIITGLAPDTPAGILEKLAAPLAESGIVSDKKLFVEGLLQREEMMSTGIGGGAAIPHVRYPERLPADRPALVMGTCPEGVEWKAIDGKPVRLFLLPASGSVTVHLRLLSAIRELLAAPDMTARLVRAASARDIMSELMKYEVRQHSSRTRPSSGPLHAGGSGRENHPKIKKGETE